MATPAGQHAEKRYRQRGEGKSNRRTPTSLVLIPVTLRSNTLEVGQMAHGLPFSLASAESRRKFLLTCVHVAQMHALFVCSKKLIKDSLATHPKLSLG